MGLATWVGEGLPLSHSPHFRCALRLQFQCVRGVTGRWMGLATWVGEGPPQPLSPACCLSLTLNLPLTCRLLYLGLSVPLLCLPGLTLH